MLERNFPSPCHPLISVDDEIKIVGRLNGGGEFAGMDQDGADGLGFRQLELGHFLTDFFADFRANAAAEISSHRHKVIGGCG